MTERRHYLIMNVPNNSDVITSKSRVQLPESHSAYGRVKVSNNDVNITVSVVLGWSSFLILNRMKKDDFHPVSASHCWWKVKNGDSVTIDHYNKQHAIIKLPLKIITKAINTLTAPLHPQIKFIIHISNLLNDKGLTSTNGIRY